MKVDQKDSDGWFVAFGVEGRCGFDLGNENPTTSCRDLSDSFDDLAAPPSGNTPRGAETPFVLPFKSNK